MIAITYLLSAEYLGCYLVNSNYMSVWSQKIKRMSKGNEFLMLLLYKVPVRIGSSSIFF